MTEKPKETPKKELECPKKYVYDTGIIFECKDNIRVEIIGEDVVDLLNELHEKNHFLKEKEKDMLDYLKKEYDYVYNQKRKHFDDAILVRGYELIEYHIKSMIEHLEGL